MRLSPNVFLCGFLICAPVLAQAEDIAPAALNSLSSVPAGLTSAQVMDQNGHVLGKAEQVQTDQDGKPAALSFRAWTAASSWLRPPPSAMTAMY